MLRFTKAEIPHIIIATIVIAFLFAFDDKKFTFELSYWLLNFLRIFIMVFIMLVIHQIGHKLIAARHSILSECRLWNIERYWFHPSAYFKVGKGIFKIRRLYIGIIFPLILILLSNGVLICPTVEHTFFDTKRKRLGYKYPNVTNYEISKIALAGPFMNLLLIAILKSFNQSGSFDQFIAMNAVFAIINLIPLPNLDGGKALFGSIQLYAFAIVFALLFVIFINVYTIFAAIILSLIIAIAAGISFYWYKVYRL